MLINNVDVLKTASSPWSSWLNIQELQSCQFFMKATSTGTPTLTLEAQIAAVDGTDTTNFALTDFAETKTVTNAGAKAFAFYDPPGEMDRPCCHVRIRVSVATADCTDIYAGLVLNQNSS